MHFRLRVVSLISTLIILTGWYLINWHVNKLDSLRKEDFVHISSRSPAEWKADKSRGKIYHSEFEGLDFRELLAKIEDANSQNLQVRIPRNKKDSKERVSLKYTDLVFPQMIDISKPQKQIPSKRYIFVHNQYTDQLSKNTRAFLSLCAQAGKSGRKVVIPFVKETKLGSTKSWLPFETYYDVKYLKRLLAAAGYGSLVDDV